MLFFVSYFVSSNLMAEISFYPQMSFVDTAFINIISSEFTVHRDSIQSEEVELTTIQSQAELCFLQKLFPAWANNKSDHESHDKCLCRNSFLRFELLCFEGYYEAHTLQGPRDKIGMLSAMSPGAWQGRVSE